MFLLPSLFTVGNIAAGFFSITETIKAISGNAAPPHLDWAAIAILFAIPFDALDGRIARMTNTCSEFGKELDSLADAITFGVAPSLLALIWGFHFLPDSINLRVAPAPDTGRRLHLLPVSHRRGLAAGALQHQPRCPAAQSGAAGAQVFCGHADSRCGGPVGRHRAFCYGIPVQAWWVAVIWLVIVGLSGFLMVSTWRFWSGQGDQLLPPPSLPVAVSVGRGASSSSSGSPTWCSFPWR